jgi:zinc protease
MFSKGKLISRMVLLLTTASILTGCPRRVKLPERANVGGLMVYDYSGVMVLHQFSGRDYVHVRLHFGWQQPEESSHAAQSLAVETAFAAGAGDFLPTEFATRLEGVGATIDFVPTAEGPVIQMNCLPERLEAALGLFNLCLAKPRFDRAAFQALRSARVAAQKAAEADHSQQALAAALEGAWPMGETVAGKAADYEAVALATAEATFLELMRKRCNLRLVTVGPIEAEQIADLLYNAVEALPLGECATSSPEISAPQLQQVKLVHASQGMQAVAGLFPGPPPGATDAIPMRLIMHMVEKRLRENVVRHHIATEAEASYVGTAPGYNLIQITGANAFQCAEFCLSELRKVKAGGFTEVEVAHAKKALQTKMGLGYESAPGLAATLDGMAGLGKPTLAGNEGRYLEAARAKDLTAMLRAYLTGITWGIVGDTAGIDRKSLQRL